MEAGSSEQVRRLLADLPPEKLDYETPSDNVRDDALKEHHWYVPDEPGSEIGYRWIDRGCRSVVTRRLGRAVVVGAVSDFALELMRKQRDTI